VATGWLQAEDAIKASGEYKPAFITDALIEAKENEILRGRHGGVKMNQGKGLGGAA